MTVEQIAKSHNWNMPITCKVCGEKLTLTDNHTYLRCPNDFCKSKYAGRINKWTDTLKIKEFGLTTIEKMVGNNIFKTITDLYTADYSKIAELEGFGEKSASKMKKEIDTHLEMSLPQFIAGFNITDCGESIIQNIMDGTGKATLDDFLNSDAKGFITTGVKDKTANKLYEGIQKLKEDMQETSKYVKIKVVQKVEGVLCGKSFCFTGPAQRKRADLWKMVETNGGIVHESVKKDTTYLVTNTPNSGSSKNLKALKQGTTVITENDFLGMCDL